MREAARELHYVPNALGRSLSRQKTDAIGLLLPDLFGEFFSELMRGSDQTAKTAHYHLIVSSSHNNREEIEATLHTLRGRVDGLVIMSPHIDESTLERNLPRGLPVVLLNCYLDRHRYDSLVIDNYGGAYAMVAHLLGHGHRRIAAVSGNPANIDASERLRGYRAAMKDAGGEEDDALVVEGAFNESSGYEAGLQLLALPRTPTAIFASNDSMAIGVLSALREAGVRIPEDIALAGFDDIPIATYLTPSLTSVNVGIHSLGVRAIDLLLEAVRNKNTHVRRQAVLPTTLSLRGSCGCRASSARVA